MTGNEVATAYRAEDDGTIGRWLEALAEAHQDLSRAGVGRYLAMDTKWNERLAAAAESWGDASPVIGTSDCPSGPCGPCHILIARGGRAYGRT